MSDDDSEFLQTLRVASSEARGDLVMRFACIASAEQLAHMLDGGLNTMVVLEHEFERRFPKEHAEWLRRTGGD